MAARDETGAGMSDLELRDELQTLLFAGHEHDGIALAWAVYWLHRDPAALARLRSRSTRSATTPSPT